MLRRKHKFNAKACEADEIKFSSKKERDYYYKLKMLEKTGKILFFLMQVPFRIPGGVIYRLDFMEFWAPVEDEPGDIIFTEVKGFLTDSARIKLAIVSEIYGIEINIIK